MRSLVSRRVGCPHQLLPSIRTQACNALLQDAQALQCCPLGQRERNPPLTLRASFNCMSPANYPVGNLQSVCCLYSSSYSKQPPKKTSACATPPLQTSQWPFSLTNRCVGQTAFGTHPLPHHTFLPAPDQKTLFPIAGRLEAVPTLKHSHRPKPPHPSHAVPPRPHAPLVSQPEDRPTIRRADPHELAPPAVQDRPVAF